MFFDMLLFASCVHVLLVQLVTKTRFCFQFKPCFSLYQPRTSRCWCVFCFDVEGESVG